MADTSRNNTRPRLPASADGATAEVAPADRLARDAALVGDLVTAAADHQRSGGAAPDVAVEDVGAVLGLFEGMRTELDMLETQVVIEARRRGMDWRQIAACQGLRSSQAASQRYQRLVTRLEEIRQGVR
ncbi:hypothetical protein [Streptomyces sp. CA-111067]|uniref:hypothetical protein n=1 Tax=Streptomyces sp. CA-111067 TaxID=3240046 RepID=UPI003D9828B6